MDKTIKILVAISLLAFSLAFLLGKIIDCRMMNLEATKTAIRCAESEALGTETRRHCINNSIDNYIGIELDN